MSETQGMPRRPGESPPPSPLLAKSAAYFAGSLSAEEADDLQEHLANDPDLAAEFLDWHRFSSPAPEIVPTAILAAWQQEDAARLGQAIAEEQAAREEAARLIGIAVENLGRIPPPPPPSYGPEEEERARRAIERLKPLTAAERLELVKQEPKAFAGEAFASACLVEARAALPASPEDSGQWANASRAILQEAAERKELTEAIVRRVKEEISRSRAFRQVARGGEAGEPLASTGRVGHTGTSPAGEQWPMKKPTPFPVRPSEAEPSDMPLEKSAAYFAGEMDEAEAEALQDQMVEDPDVAEAVLDWQRFASPSPDLVPPETLAAWQEEDRPRLHAAIAAEAAPAAAGAPVLDFAPATERIHARTPWKILIATIGLAATVTAIVAGTAPISETFIVPASTQRGTDDVTTVILGRWPHKVRFQIDARTLGVVEEPQVRLLDSMTDAPVAHTAPSVCGEALCADFWGVDPGNYRLELEDLATGQPRLVAHHPVEIVAASTGP